MPELNKLFHPAIRLTIRNPPLLDLVMYETPLNVDTMTRLSDMNGSKNGSLFHNDGTAPSIGTNFTCQNRNAKVIYVGNSDARWFIETTIKRKMCCCE